MSLLLDALKKTGQARQDGTSDNASHLGAPDVARSAGHNLFAAKSAPTHYRARIGIIPLALMGGILLAALGGYYVWRETSYSVPPPVRVAAAPATQPADGNETTGFAATSIPQAQPVALLPAKSADATTGIIKKVNTPPSAASATRPSPSPPRRLPAAPDSGIAIKRSQAQDAVGPALAAAYQDYRNGDYTSAWQRYRSVLQQDARNRDALLGMAAIAQQQGQDATAAEYYGQVLTLDPRDPAAHAGMSALTKGDAAATESRLKLLLAQRPDAPELYFVLGNLYAGQSRWGEAQQSYFSAVNRDPDKAQYLFNLAVSLDHLGQGKLAAQYYQRALQQDQAGAENFDHAQTRRRLNELTAP